MNNKYKKELSEMKLSDEYKENLKQTLISEAHQANQINETIKTSQANQTNTRSKNKLFGYRKYFVLAPVCVILIVLGVFLFRNTSSDETNINMSDNKSIDIDIEKNSNNYDVNGKDFVLVAMKSDSQGIEPSTGFKLNSKIELNADKVNKMINIEPKTEFKVEEVSSTVYNIIPLAGLTNNSIYRISLDNDGKQYSWAFQTKNEFSVESTIPSNQGQYVPIDSGIEMYFTMKDLEDIDKYFTISPYVEGRFIYKDNSVIFTTEKLSYSTNYTITIKAGYGSRGSEQKLQNDYTFRFTTTNDPNIPIYFISPLTSIYKDNTKYIQVDISREYREKEFTINIYKYNSFDKFYDDFELYTNESVVRDSFSDDAKKIANITQKVSELRNDYGTNRYFLLPDELELGYYIVEFVDDKNGKCYSFLQINDMLVYSALFDKQLFATVLDGKTSAPLKNVDISINNEKAGRTDRDGILLADIDYKDYENTNIIMTASKSGYNNLIVYYNSIGFFDYFNFWRYNNLEENNSNYLVYLDTDRSTYLPTDTVNVWGYARPKNSSFVNSVRIELVEAATGLVLDIKTVDLSEAGTYQAGFDINGFTSGSYYIKVYDNDVLISTEVIEVNNYTKPLYTMAGELSKDYLYRGEKLNYKVNASFFDGSPVPNIDIKYYNQCYQYRDGCNYNNSSEDFKLDENGEINIDVDTNISSTSWRPVEITLNTSNNTAEDKNISIYNRFLIFPKHTMLEIEQNEEQKSTINILLHSLNLDKYDKNDYSYKSLRDEPLSGRVNVKITEEHTEKRKVREEYDFINKKNIVIYDYDIIKNVVYNEAVNVENGLASIVIPDYQSDSYYTVEAEYYCPEGSKYSDGLIAETTGFSDNYYSFYYRGTDMYTLGGINDEKFKVNEDVNLYVEYDNKAIENADNDRFIVLMMQNGLVDYKTSDSTAITTKFVDKYIPNVMLKAIYIKNGVMNECEVYDGLKYDINERKINIDVKPDKANYKPGEAVSLDIATTDEKGRPVSADVNISVVDEAYFAIYKKTTDTLSELYAYKYNSGLRKEGISNTEMGFDMANAAEMGGGGDYLDALREKFEDTNVFQTVATDKNGKASLSFTLADNLTSWRITAQAISKNSFAGSTVENINTRLPLFVDMIVGKQYLKEDNIGVVLRTFGTDAVSNEKVNYEVILKNKVTDEEKTYSKDGLVGAYTNVEFGTLDIGEYEVIASVSYKDYKDAVKKEFTVAESLISFNNTSYYELSEDTVLNKVYSNPVITLFNESRSDFYNSLSNIAYSYGLRVDQSVASVIATKFINEYFNPKYKLEANDLANELMKYQNNNGVALLTYSSDDTELTAKLDNLINDTVINNTHRVYFKNILKSSDLYSTQIAAALWGLSKYNEPVLLDIYDVLENNTDLSIRDRIYLSLALAELGDVEKAIEIYKDILDNSVSSEGTYISVNSDLTVSDRYELSALMMVLSGKLNDYANGDKLFRYVYNNPSKYTLTNLEQLGYIIDRNIMELPEIKDLFGSITVVVNGKEQTYELKLFDTESFAVKKDEISSIRFKNINGKIACKVDALGNIDNILNNKTTDFSINARYSGGTVVDGMLSCTQSDVIMTELKIDSNEDRMLEVTYIMPAGFRYVDRLNNDGITTSRPVVDGQKLTFYVFYDTDRPDDCKINFYMQAAQKGKYAVDYIVVKEIGEDKLSYVDKSFMLIK